MEKAFVITLKEIRKQRYLTQEQLAEASNINEKYYGRIERGESYPTIPIFFCICNALDISPYKFMEIMEDNIKKNNL